MYNKQKSLLLAAYSFLPICSCSLGGDFLLARYYPFSYSFQPHNLKSLNPLHTYDYYSTSTMASRPVSTRGRKKTYGSVQERKEARNARRQQKRREERALQRDVEFQNAFQQPFASRSDITL